jgi:hypothetical protein
LISARAHLVLLHAEAVRKCSDADAATTRLADEPANAPLTPAIAGALIAAAARLAQAELALHALALPSLHAGRPAERVEPVVAQRIDVLTSALDTALNRLAPALQGLVPPEPIPALRPIQAQLRAEAAMTGSAVVGPTDLLVDAVNTVDAILRERFPVAFDARQQSARKVRSPQ